MGARWPEPTTPTTNLGKDFHPTHSEAIAPLPPVSEPALAQPPVSQPPPPTTPPPPPVTDPSAQAPGDLTLPPSGWSSALLAAAIAGVLALLLGLGGPGSLLLDLGLALWVAAVSVVGKLRVRSGDLATAGSGVARLVKAARAALPSKGFPKAGTPLAVMALVLVPVLAGLFSSMIALTHHSDENDVCEAYLKYQEETTKPNSSTFGFDSAWFDALDDLGKVAEDYGGKYQREATHNAGKAARRIAKGSGSGVIVTASVGEANYVVAPLSDFCAMGD